MISEKKFLKYQVEVERRFSRLNDRISELKTELTSQDLHHKLEMERFKTEVRKEIETLKTELAHKEALAEVKAQYETSKDESEEEKAKREDEKKVANIMQLYSEDPETLRRLGFNLPGDGGVNG